MRTVEDFVTEMICRDRTKQQIRSIALGSRWSTVVDNVMQIYDELVAPVNKENAA